MHWHSFLVGVAAGLLVVAAIAMAIDCGGRGE